MSSAESVSDKLARQRRRFVRALARFVAREWAEAGTTTPSRRDLHRTTEWDRPRLLCSDRCDRCGRSGASALVIRRGRANLLCHTGPDGCYHRVTVYGEEIGASQRPRVFPGLKEAL